MHPFCGVFRSLQTQGHRNYLGIYAQYYGRRPVQIVEMRVVHQRAKTIFSEKID